MARSRLRLGRLVPKLKLKRSTRGIIPNIDTPNKWILVAGAGVAGYFLWEMFGKQIFQSNVAGFKFATDERGLISYEPPEGYGLRVNTSVLGNVLQSNVGYGSNDPASRWGRGGYGSDVGYFAGESGTIGVVPTIQGASSRPDISGTNIGTIDLDREAAATANSDIGFDSRSNRPFVDQFGVASTPSVGFMQHPTASGSNLLKKKKSTNPDAILARKQIHSDLKQDQGDVQEDKATLKHHFRTGVKNKIRHVAADQKDVENKMHHIDKMLGQAETRIDNLVDANELGNPDRVAPGSPLATTGTAPDGIGAGDMHGHQQLSHSMDNTRQGVLELYLDWLQKLEAEINRAVNQILAALGIATRVDIVTTPTAGHSGGTVPPISNPPRPRGCVQTQMCMQGMRWSPCLCKCQPGGILELSPSDPRCVHNRGMGGTADLEAGDDTMTTLATTPASPPDIDISSIPTANVALAYPTRVRSGYRNRRSGAGTQRFEVPISASQQQALHAYRQQVSGQIGALRQRIANMRAGLNSANAQQRRQIVQSIHQTQQQIAAIKRTPGGVFRSGAAYRLAPPTDVESRWGRTPYAGAYAGYYYGDQRTIPSRVGGYGSDVGYSMTDAGIPTIPARLDDTDSRWGYTLNTGD